MPRLPRKKSSWIFLKTGLIIAGGVAITVMLMNAGLNISEKRILKIQDNNNAGLLKTQCDYRILCIGESTTQGEYPPFLDRILNTMDSGVKVCIFDEGILSTTTSTVLAKLEQNLDRYRPHMVISMLGINEANVFVSAPSDSNSTPYMVHIRQSKIYSLIKKLWLNVEYKYLATKVFIKHHLKFKEYSIDEFIRRTRENMSNDRILRQEIHSLARDAKRSKAYSNLRKIYNLKDQRWLEQATCLQAIEEDPLSVWNWFDLANMLDNQEERELIYDTLTLLLENSLRLDPQNSYLLDYYRNLGWFYIGNKKYLPRGGAVFERLVKMQPTSIAYACYARYWMLQNDFRKAAMMYHEALRQNPKDSFVWSGLAVLSEQKGDAAGAEYSRQQARRYRTLGDYPKTTAENYSKIKEKVIQRNIKFVAVQYPLRPLEPLREILDGDERVIFVSNELSFKKAVTEEGYSSYFRDIFAGDFGHCTEKGNQLLAKNIASAIRDEITNK